MIAPVKKASQTETVRRNGYPAVRENARPSKVELSDQAEALKQQAEALSQLARLLQVAIERLVAASEALLLTNVNVELGIDLHAEIKRYELLLIQRALRKAQGSQVKASALLKLKPTTLNSKIKRYAGRDGKANSRNKRFSSLS